MKFKDNDLQEYIGTDIRVYKEPDGTTIMMFYHGNFMRNEESYSTSLLGKCASCDSFYTNLFNDFTYDSVLIAGLGFGLIPNELSEVNQCSKIDVVEISQEVIDYNISSGHLNPMINLIQGDIFAHTTSEKYDLIIVDIVWVSGDMTDEQFQTLASRFSSNLNAGGAIFSPVSRHWSTDLSLN